MQVKAGNTETGDRTKLLFKSSNTTVASAVVDDGSAGQYAEVDLTIDTDGLVLASEKGAADGVAELDGDALVPAAQIPPITSTMITDGTITTGDLAFDVNPPTGQVAISAMSAPFNNNNWNTPTLNTAYWTAGGNLSTGSASGDWIEYRVYLHAGTYSLNLLHRKAPNAGIYTISVDGSDFATTIDGYVASAANGNDTVTGITVTGSTVHAIRLTIKSRNASNSAGWLGAINLITLTRTGA